MRSPRTGPRRTTRVKVPDTYQQMAINTEFDIDDIDRDGHLVTPTYIHNNNSIFTFNTSNTSTHPNRNYQSQT